MRPGMRFGLSACEKLDVWRRWKAGQSLHEIGRAFDKLASSIHCLLLPRGGIPPLARRRSRLALTRSEREDISRGIASGSSIREIASRLIYRAHEADQQAWKAALRPKRCLLAVNRRLRDIVASKLILDWSPEQISGWLKTRYPNNESMRDTLNSQQISKFLAALNHSEFWKMPTESSNRGMDGGEWILEAVQRDTYHVVARWCPNNTAFGELAGDLFELAHHKSGRGC